MLQSKTLSKVNCIPRQSIWGPAARRQSCAPKKLFNICIFSLCLSYLRRSLSWRSGGCGCELEHCPTSSLKNQKIIFLSVTRNAKLRMRVWFYETGWGARKNCGKTVSRRPNKKMIVIYMNSATKFCMRKLTTTDDNLESRTDRFYDVVFITSIKINKTF